MTDRLQIGICKIGTNITWKSVTSTAAMNDIKYVTDILVDWADVRIYSQRTRNTQYPNVMTFHEIQDLTNEDFPDQPIDILLVFGGPINFYGGSPDHNTLAIYRFMRFTNVPIFFIHTDSQHYLRELWPSIEKRDWVKNYNRDDFNLSEADISYITQHYDTNKFFGLLNDPSKKKQTVKVPLEKIFHFDLASLILDYGLKRKMVPIDYKESRPYDLVYGGSIRDTNRRNRLNEYYHRRNQRFSVMLFGNMREFGWQYTVPPKSFVKMMAKGKSTVIIGDEEYYNSWFTLRLYESVLAGCIPFIDARFDKEKRFYHNFIPNSDYQYLYIENYKQLVENWFAEKDLFPEMSSYIQTVLYYGHDRNAASNWFQSKLTENSTKCVA